MKLAIVGAHTQPNERWIDYVRRYIDRQLQVWKVDLVISGGADLVDTVAVEVAQARGIETVEIMPEVKSWQDIHGRKGFRTRNMEIAEMCTHLFNVRWPGQKTFGSGWTANYAQTLRKPVKRMVVNAQGVVTSVRLTGFPNNDDILTGGIGRSLTKA